MTGDVMKAEVVTSAGTHGRVEAAEWSRVLRYWHLGFYALVAIAAGSLAASASDRPEGWTIQLTASLLALGALVVAYATVGHRAVEAEDVRRGLAYLTVVFAVTTFVTALDPLGTVLLFVAYSQVWLLTPTTRAGAYLCVVLTALVTLAILFRLRDSGENPLVVVFEMLLGLTFALLIGVWLRTVISQGNARVHLLDQLEAAQAEVGRSSRAAGVTAERERLAREIHDTLAQGFTSVVMLAQRAGVDLDRGEPEAVAQRLALIERTARENLSEARSLIAAFAPPALQGSSLEQALRRLVARVEEETGVMVSVSIDLPDDEHRDTLRDTAPTLPPGADVVLLRAAQESLSNVRRHSRATRVGLDLRLAASGATLVVRDDGVGIGAGVTEGFGLQGMRERVRAYGGSVHITSPSPAGGTEVRVVVPTMTGAAPGPTDG